MFNNNSSLFYIPSDRRNGFYFSRQARKRLKKIANKSLVVTVAITTIFWSLGAPLSFLIPKAQAASIVPSTIGLLNGNFSGAPIKASSTSTAVVKLSITASAASKFLTAVTINFSGTGFEKTDLATLATDATSGVALYKDGVGGTASVFDGPDSVIVASSTAPLVWSSAATGSTTTIYLNDPVTDGALASDSAKIFYIVIKTSATAADNDQIIATIPIGGVVTSDSANATGPATAFTANSFRVDKVAPTIVSVTGNSLSNDLMVSFSEPVQKFGGGNLDTNANQFTFVDNGTVTTHSTSTATHTIGQSMATVTLTGIDAGDFTDTPSTLAAATNGIMDMAGNIMLTTAKNLTSPITITTATIPATYTSATYTVGSPLVTFAATGASGYIWATSTLADDLLLQSLGLTVNSTGNLFATSSVSTKTGNYFVSFRATNSSDLTASTTKYFSINVAATSGGSMPGISSITPGGSAQGSAPGVTISGTNTGFSNSSQVQFLLNGSNDTNVAAGTVTASASTTLSFILTIAAGATIGNRDLRVTTGSQIVFMPNAFSVFASGGALGLGLNLPTDGATGVSLSPPPNFNFNPSTTGGVNSYRITVKPNSDFSGTALWDYVFPTYALNTSSHCSASTCNANYGAGQFMVLTQPTPLVPNTTYYWNVRTYTQMPFSVNDAAVPLDSTTARGFTTSGSVTDSMPPTIQHRQLFSATASQDLNVFARVMDNLARANTTPALATTLIYCAGAGCAPSSSVSGTEVGNGYYKYTIPSSAVGAAGAIVRYWLSASDDSNTALFKGPGATAFQLTTTGAGVATITGAVTGLVGATVFAEGTGYSTTTIAGGAYTLENLSPGTYDIVALKAAYADRSIQGIPAGASGINFTLPSGGGGGFGGDTAKPRIKFTGPPDGMTGVPGGDSNFKIFMGFDKAMSQTSVTTADNMYVKELNPATGETTDITTTKGSWAYYATNPGSGNMPPDNNLAVWSLSAGQTFGDNKTIMVIVTANVTDTANNSVSGNQSDGSYAFSFTTGRMANFTGFIPGVGSSGGTFSGGGTFGSGAFTPPFVTGSTPTPGTFDVPVNQKIVINFSEAMADDASPYFLKNYIKPYVVSGANPPYVETAVASGAYSVSLDTSKKIATVTITGNMSVSTRYRVKVLGGAKASSGMTLSPPGSENSQMFMIEFKTSSNTSGDIAAPSITGLFPSGGATAVSVNTGAVNVGFNKDMDASTMTTSNFYLSIGSTAVNGTVDYRPSERQAYFMPKNALNATTTYTINLTASVLALNGQALTATTSTFTTGGADTSLPTVSFINADDYSIAITFSEPMNAAKAVDTLNYSSSVLKSSLYTIKQAASNAQSGTAVTLGADVALSYDAITNTVIIKGISLTAGNEVYVSVGAVKDAAGNAMSGSNTAKATVLSSANTKGSLGPGAMSTDAFSMGGGFMPTSFSGNTFGFAPPVEVRPMSMMAGKTTVYHVDLPISKRILAGGTIILTFPTGFDISGAKQDVNSPMRGDLNGPGTGTPTFRCLTNVTGGKSCAVGANADDTGAAQGGLADDGVVVNAVARIVTIYLSANTNSEGHDFLNLDIAGIINSAVPKDFNTTGYTVDVKTKNSTTLLESLTSMPFFIQSGGAYTLSGTITATGIGALASTTKVYLMSPMTGPTDTTSSNFNASSQATYSFTGLAAGEYFLFTDPMVTLGSTEFSGKAMPERIGIAANKTYDFTMANNSTGGTDVTITIVNGPANEPIDIFASSPTGFKAKQITLDGTANNSENFTINLANGQWMIGVGPQMPKGPMAGPPPMPNYMPPKPENVTVQSTGSPTVVEASDTANDGTLKFTLSSASKYIKGTVKDGANKVMANAEVFAYSPQGGMGTHGQTATDGTFSLGVTDGSYIVGSFVPGMPPSKEVSVIVTSADSAYLLIDGATTAITADAAQTAFVLKVAKPDYTISGKVTDGTNVIQGANVYAYRSDGPGHANTNTDSSGNYTLYVSNGTWKVGVFLPQYGQLTEQTVSINGASASNQNFAPSSTGTFSTVSGTVTVGGANKQGAFVRINGNNTSNEAITDLDGAYSFKVPQGNGYIVKLNIPGMGEASTTAVFNISGDVTKDFAIGAANTITILTSATVSKALVELMSINGIGGRSEITNATSTTLSLPNGSYRVQVNIPGMALPLTAIAGTTGANTVYATSTGVGIITVDSATESLTITLPTLRTVAGTVNVADAWVEIINTTSGVHFGAKTSTTTPSTFSLQVTDSAVDYMINAMKPGYFRSPTALTVNGGNPDSQTLTMSASTLAISGTITIGGSTGAANAFVRAEKQGGGFAGIQADANGVYSLPVDAGTWKVYAGAEGYAETAYASNPITVSASSVGSKDISLSATVSLNAPKSKPITPFNGGTLDDPTAGIKITMPPKALGQDTGAGNIQAKETNNVRSTSTAYPVGGKAQEIKATDSENNPINLLDNSITVEMSYSNANLATTRSATDSSIDTKAEVDKLQMSYWDETTSNWVSLPSTITYYKSDGTILDSSDAAHTPAANLSNVATTTIAAATTHLSLYAPTSASGGSPPATPSDLAASVQSTSQINLSWTAISGAISYDIYRNTVNSGNFARLGGEPTTTSVSYSDTGLTAGTTYYYKITALSGDGESAASSAVTATTNSNSPAGGGSPSLGGSVSLSSLGLTTPTPTPSPSPSPSPSPAASVTATLIRYVNDPKVYVIENGQKRWVQTAEDFAKLGYKWSDVKIAPASETYPDGTVMKVPSASSAVTLIRYANEPKVYVVENNQKRWVKTGEDFAKLGYKWSDVKIAPASETYTTGSDKTATTPSASSAVTLIRYANDPKVYVIENNQKRWVKTGEDFTKLGYKWSDVKITPATETYTDGAAKTATEATAALTKDLKKGSTGAEVKIMQQKLKDLGYFPANVATTTYFGNTTLQALKNFQKDKNLSPTGQLNSQTRDLLNQ